MTEEPLVTVHLPAHWTKGWELAQPGAKVKFHGKEVDIVKCDVREDGGWDLTVQGDLPLELLRPHDLQISLG